MDKLPNILLITVDQQRYDCLGFVKTFPVRTPNLDQLAAEGLSFTNAYSHLPVCGPARQSFINCRRPELIGGLWNYSGGLKIPALEPEEYSWARTLKEKKYQTGYIGKWGVHPQYDATYYGFDQCVQEQEYIQYLNELHPKSTATRSFFGQKSPIPLKNTKTHWTAEKAITMIQEYSLKDDPWLIRVNFSEPHLPCEPSEPFSDWYRPEDIPMWPSFTETFTNKPYVQKQQLHNWEVQDFTWDDWAPIVARYYGIISQLDDAIGRILTSLQRQSDALNTIVIYTSDHGDLCGGHRMMDKHYVMYEEVVRVPLILSWPNIIKAGVCDQFVYNFLDLPPTILDWLNLPIPSFAQGQSLVPLIKNHHMPSWRKEVIVTYNGQQFGLYTQRMIRTIQWKYVWNLTDVDELYDLKSDANELNNLICEPSHADLLKQLRETLFKELDQQGDGIVKNQWMKNQLLKGNKN
ncbi:sulfatase-like hydrolase/transferase [Fictibacillus fluitans]|uniref:Sulfatase-like hydrolase/transferase n=1 Tax=Fictibacillus fluitans TaxID=3058422 RepID=A0ABT8HR38_9BACL|nr:sulfatase-like hydrolase/transferase [Fictibacillus sp. NE201]MDN4522980.1 sulfatase-like hydrolase/transferase [Fictibacillus sp. NE201]